MERSAVVATKSYMKEIETLLTNVDEIESCRREEGYTKWKFYKLTIGMLSAVLFKDVPKDCKNAVFTEPIIRKYSVNWLTFKKSFRKP